MSPWQNEAGIRRRCTVQRRASGGGREPMAEAKRKHSKNEIHSTVHSNAVRNQGAHVSRPDFVTPPPCTHWGMVRFPIPAAQPNQGESLEGIGATVPFQVPG